MKKNFLKVAALLIAAMLMVVSCTQEVAPVNNGLVEATIGLAYGKDVVVDYGTDETAIIYKYELTALWDKLTNGAPIYGATEGEVLVYGKDADGNPVTKKLSDNLDSFNPNYVTPGYWRIDVKGYIGSNVVLSGTTKAYFNGTKGSAIVYVAPVATSDVKGNLTIELVMEDLDKDDADDAKASKIKYTLDKGTTSEEVGTVTKTTPVAGKAAHNYKIELDNVTAGYHTITISVDGYSKGGVTRSFLMIPGKDVTVRGSIYPSEFINTESSITVVSLGQNFISIGETRPVEFSDSYSEGPVTVDAGSSVKVSIGEFMNPFTNNTTGITYEWYLDGVKTGMDTNDAYTTITAPSTPGDYTVTCIAKLSYNSGTVGQVTVYGDSKHAGLIRVEATGNKVATTN